MKLLALTAAIDALSLHKIDPYERIPFKLGYDQTILSAALLCVRYDWSHKESQEWLEATWMSHEWPMNDLIALREDLEQEIIDHQQEAEYLRHRAARRRVRE